MKNYSNEVLNNLPGCVCEILQTLSDKYSNEPWYDEACDRYSYHVLTTDTDNVRMPGYIFSKYIKDNDLEHSEEICNKDYVKSILEHSGTKGMKKGVNKYRNPDGTLNEEGKRRYYPNRKEKPKFPTPPEPPETPKPPKVKRVTSKSLQNEYGKENYTMVKDALSKSMNRPKKDSNGKDLRDKDNNIIWETKVTEKDIGDKLKYDRTKEYIDDTVTLLNETNKLVSNVKNAIPQDQGTKIYSSHPELTDIELRNKINRLKTEHEYSDLVGETKYVKSGSEKTREILQTVGSSIAIIGSAAVVAGSIVDLIAHRKKIPGTKKNKGKK